MDNLFKKLNYKGQTHIYVFNTPTSFEPVIASIANEVPVKLSVKSDEQITFAIGFATKQQEVNELVDSVAPRLVGDAIFWVCYPKASSKNYTCDFNRDTGWEIMGKYNMEGVRLVAIDADWSALRFRKIEFIQKFTRRASMALSEEGKQRGKKEEKNPKQDL